MSDVEGNMALVLSNAQSELTPLERGFHALRSPLDGKAYAATVGSAQSTVAKEIQGARVATDVHSEIDLSPYVRHLAEIHAAAQFVTGTSQPGTPAMSGNLWAMPLWQSMQVRSPEASSVPCILGGAGALAGEVHRTRSCGSCGIRDCRWP